MRIEVGCVTARVVEATPEERRWIRGYLTFDDPQARFSNSERFLELVNAIDDTFPAGFAGKVRVAGLKANPPVTVELVDVRPAPPPLREVDIGWLRPYQQAALEACLKRTRGIVQISTGGGKCLGRDTPVLLFDGRIVPVQEVQEGDLLMGPDSKPRRVLSTTQGVGPLYRIVPLRGTPWVCNDAHVLTLAHTQTGNLVDIPLNEYLTQSKRFRHLHKQVGTGVEFVPRESPLPIDPYFLGVWFGDGTKNLESVSVSKPDPEIRQLMSDTAEVWGLDLRVDQYREGGCPTYRLVRRVGARNRLLDTLREIVGNASTIPQQYLMASKAERAALLAGLLDTDGYRHRTGFEIVQRQISIASGILFVARSLGLRALCREKTVNGMVYYRVSISGDCSELPLRIPRKKAGPRQINKHPTRTGFSVEPLGEGAYFGFTLDGDGRFLLGDFTITHNTEVMAALVARMPERWLILVPQADLLEQTAARIEARTGERPGLVGDGQWAPQRVTVATFQTLHRRLTKGTREARAATAAFLAAQRGLVVDECHTVAAGSLNLVCARATSAHYRIGFSATPLDRSDRRSIFVVAQLGGILHQTTSAELRALGMLAEAHIKMVRVTQGSTAPTWQGVYGDCVVRSKPRNAVVAQMALVATKPALVFVSQVGHGQKLMPLLQRAGLRAELVWGEDSTDERRAALARLTSGALDVIVCSSVFQQAIDVPSLRSVVNAAGGASIIQTLQRIGRGTRVTAEKKAFETWDVLDDGHRWLRKHGALRKDTYEAEGYRVEVLDAVPGAEVPLADTRRDEHGFVLGSAEADAARAARRAEALRDLAGVDRLRNPRRGRVLRPHRVSGYACTDCGAPADALPPECAGTLEAQTHLPGAPRPA